MTTSHQLFLKEKKVDVVILAYLLLFVLLFTSWGQARNHHIPVRCPAKFLNFPQIYFFLFCSAGCQRLLYSSFFYITETAKRHATARYLKKQNKILGFPRNVSSTDNIEEIGNSKKYSVSRLFSFNFDFDSYSNATEKT
jgi:hypothetical protein